MGEKNSEVQKRRRKDSCGQILYAVALLAALAVFLFSVYHILCYVWEVTENWKVTDDMIRKAVAIETEAESVEELIPDPAEDGSGLKAPITVDFEAAKRENPDIVAWIYCPDTVINYPVVQAQDNEYYLRRLVDGRTNSAGSLFLDYRNASDFSDLHSVIYGHNMKNGTMFGSLTNYYEQEHYDRHPVMYLLTPEKDYKVELYVGYVDAGDADIYTYPMTREKMAEVLNASMRKTHFRSQAKLTEKDRFLTLSTCAYEYDDARYILVGVLRELE